MDYVNIHTHSEYSNIRLLDSINKITDLIDYAAKVNYKGIGITDHGCLSSHVKAIQHIQKQKKDKIIPEDFKLILGEEIYLIDDIDKYKDNYDSKTMKYYHFILLAKNITGHEQLRKISSKAWENSYKQRNMDRVPITYKEIAEIVQEDPGNVIGSTACLGSYFAQAILNKEDSKAKKLLEWGASTFGKENFFIEIQPSIETPEQQLYNLKAYDYAKEYEIPIIVTTDAHYLAKEDREIHKAYLNSKEGEREVDAFYGSTYLMTTEEIQDYLKENGFNDNMINECIANSMKIYDMCDEYDLKHEPVVPKFDLPSFQLHNLLADYYDQYFYINKFANSEDMQDRYLFYQIECGLIEKFINKGIEYTDFEIARINIEMEDLWELSEDLNIKMSSYYNTMKKIIDIMWEDGDSIVGPARGSVTGFFIAYLLNISQVNPLKWNLPNWRHINKFKKELADIDTDTEAMKRGSILETLKDFFGEESVVNICTFGTETAKSAILTGARGLNIDVDTGLYIASMVPMERGFLWSISDCLYGNEEKERKPIKNFIKEINKYPKLTEVVLGIEGLVNKRSIHASGIYIFNEHYSKFNAIMKAPNGQKVTQFNMNDSDYCGGLKFDLLTVQALDKIRLTINFLLEDKVIEDQGSLIKNYNKYLHPDILDYETFEMWDRLSDNAITDLFQFETEVKYASII